MLRPSTHRTEYTGQSDLDHKNQWPGLEVVGQLWT